MNCKRTCQGTPVPPGPYGPHLSPRQSSRLRQSARTLLFIRRWTSSRARLTDWQSWPLLARTVCDLSKGGPAPFFSKPPSEASTHRRRQGRAAGARRMEGPARPSQACDPTQASRNAVGTRARARSQLATAWQPAQPGAGRIVPEPTSQRSWGLLVGPGSLPGPAAPQLESGFPFGKGKLPVFLPPPSLCLSHSLPPTVAGDDGIRGSGHRKSWPCGPGGRRAKSLVVVRSGRDVAPHTASITAMPVLCMCVGCLMVSKRAAALRCAVLQHLISVREPRHR